jgi:hypothetical protein
MLWFVTSLATISSPVTDFCDTVSIEKNPS